MKRFTIILACWVLIAMSIIIAPSYANEFNREPYPDEKYAVQLLIEHKTPAARRYLAWIRHDYAVKLFRQFSATKSMADLDTGLKYAQSATELAPDVATFWRVLAMGALSFPDGELTPLIAESALIRVLEIEPNDRASRRILIDHYVGIGEPDNAVEHFQYLLKTLQGRTADFDTIKMAYACLEGDQIGRCRVSLETAIDKQPGLSEARIALAILYWAQQMERKAMGMLERVSVDAMALQESRTVAKQLKAHWEKSGPLRDLPDPEDKP